MSGILITRPAPQAASARQALEASGHRIFLAPMLDITPLEWTPPDIAPQAVLVTSANAAPALAASTLSRATPVFAVGDRTATEVRRAGFIRVESAAGDASALVELVQKRCGQGMGALLYLSGEAVAGSVAARLSGAGYWVETRIVYKANANEVLPDNVRDALQDGSISIALLYSPRSAAIFSRLVSNPALRGRLALVCLSAAVAQAAGGGWMDVTISRQPDESSLIEALTRRADVV